MTAHRKKIVVQRSYSDPDYRWILRQSVQDHYWSLNSAKKTRSTGDFFGEILSGKVAQNLDRIFWDNGEQFEPDFEETNTDRSRLNDFVRIGKSPNRRFSDGFLALIDAYLQITLPWFDASYRHALRSDEMGMMFGAFLKDESALESRFQLELNKQRVVGVYEYDEADTHLNLTGDTRYLALVAGENPDYINLLDASVDFSPYLKNRAEKLKISSGFCIPGEEFSLVVMKTLCFRRRQIGLLYSVGSLVDKTGGVLDEIEFETFSAENDPVGLAASTERYGSVAFAEALKIHYGTRKRQPLRKLPKGSQREAIIKRFELLKRNML